MNGSQAHQDPPARAEARRTGPPLHAPPAVVRAALDAAAERGPFFVLDRVADDARWRRVAELYRSAEEFLAGAGGVPERAEPRVAVSIAQLGYAARLWSPVVGAALLAGVVPDLADLRIAATRPARLGIGEPRGWQAGDLAGLAELSYRSVVMAHLEPLAQTLNGRVASGLFWGNAASGLAGALGVLIAARTELREPATALAGALLSVGRLAGTGELGVTAGGLGFRRRSCCLYYRLPGGGLCGDCCLSAPPAR